MLFRASNKNLLFLFSDGLGSIPDASSLRESGIQVHGSEREETAAEKIAGMLSCFEKGKEELEPNTVHPQAMVSTGMGLAALPRKLVEKIKANEYIDFTELPPAKGKSRPIPQSLEGQVLVVQAADLLQARKIIPDLATWLQCFALYVATLAPSQPSRVPEMMAYQTIIAKNIDGHLGSCMTKILGRKRRITLLNHGQRWNQASMPSASQGKQLARRIGAFIASAWTMQPTAAHSDHANVHGVQHSLSCIRKKTDKPVCIKYNKFNGDCRFGKECRFRHVCKALVVIHIQQANARQKAAASPSEGGGTVEPTGVIYFFFLY